MAEPKAAGDEAARAGSGGASPPLAAGEPVGELPPLVEFGFDEPDAATELAPEPAAAAEPPPPGPFAGLRPERRRFLAPVTYGAPRPPARDAEARPAPPLPTPRPDERPLAGAGGEPGTARRARRWPQRLGVAAGVAAALVVAVAVELGVDPAWLHRLRGAAAEAVARI